MKRNTYTYIYLIVKSLVKMLEFIVILPVKSTLRIQNGPLASRNELCSGTIRPCFCVWYLQG